MDSLIRILRKKEERRHTSINNQTNHHHNHHRRTSVKLSARLKRHNDPLTTMKKPEETEKTNE